MGVTIIRKGRAPVKLAAQVSLCQPKQWPFPGENHILNPVTRTCVRCGNKLPNDYAGIRFLVPEALQHQVKPPITVQQEVGL